MHNVSDRFEFQPDWTTDYGVSCPWASKKFPTDLLWGKWCLHASSFIFGWIIIKVAGIQDRNKSLVEFDFWLNQTTHFGVTCSWVTKISHFWTWISLKPVCGFHGNRKPLLTYNGENDVTTFSWLLAHLSRRLTRWADKIGLEPESVCPSVRYLIQTWISLRPGVWLQPNFIWSIIRVGESLHYILGQIRSELWFPWQQIAPIGL